MDKIWFIIIDNKSEGPFTYDELRCDTRIVPDTLAWREGFVNWKKISDIPELKTIFEDVSKKDDEEEQISLLKKDPLQDELVLEMLDMRQEPPYFIWIILALVSLLYIILQLYY